MYATYDNLQVERLRLIPHSSTGGVSDRPSGLKAINISIIYCSMVLQVFAKNTVPWEQDHQDLATAKI